MKFRFNAFFFCWLMLLSSSVKGLVPVDLSLYVVPTKEAIAQIRAQWQPHLSPAELAIERTITWSVPLTWHTNGFAVRDCATGNQRQIIITAGQAFTLGQITDASLRTLAKQMNQTCFEGYLKHMADVFSTNSQPQGNMPFLTPAAFAAQSPAICQSMHGAAMSEQQWSALYNRLIKGSLNLLLAHELGHHIFNHGCTHRSISEIRDDEQQADDFAIQLMIKEDPLTILSAIPLLTFWSMNSPVTTADEFGNTHPAGLRRLRSALDAFERNLEQNKESDFYNYLVKTNQLEGFKALLSQLRESTKNLN